MDNDQRVKAIPNGKAICPLCGENVISKCGSIKIWHWAHKNNSECDSFGEPETEWHFQWKQMFPEENQEVRIENHRADIRTKEGTIIELQNSPISPEELLERELFYPSLIWILNGKTIAKNIIFFKQRYKWKWFPKSWEHAKKQIYIDKGDMFLYFLNICDCEGLFQKISKDAFIVKHGGHPWQK